MGDDDHKRGFDTVSVFCPECGRIVELSYVNKFSTGMDFTQDELPSNIAINSYKLSLEKQVKCLHCNTLILLSLYLKPKIFKK